MTTAATAIRDAVFDRISALGLYTEMQKVPVPMRQPSALPSCAVYISGETLRADGDANTGIPAFVGEIVIGISSIHGFDEPAALDGTIDSDLDAIEAALLSDETFVQLGPTALFEGVERITRRRYFPPKDGETYFAELRLEMTFISRVEFPPTIDDDYLTLHVTARPIQNPGAPPAELELDIPQN